MVNIWLGDGPKPQDTPESAYVYLNELHETTNVYLKSDARKFYVNEPVESEQLPESEDEREKKDDKGGRDKNAERRKRDVETVVGFYMAFVRERGWKDYEEDGFDLVSDLKECMMNMMTAKSPEVGK